MLKKRAVFGGPQNAVPTSLLWMAPLMIFALFYVAPNAETFKRAFAPARRRSTGSRGQPCPAAIVVYPLAGGTVDAADARDWAAGSLCVRPL